MTNVSATAAKISMRGFLFQLAVEALEKQGWSVARVVRSGKASVRSITKGKETKIVSIRTSQDTWIAFPRNKANDGWATLEGVDYVVAASVDDQHNPQSGLVHMIDAAEMRDRFDRAYTARKNAGYTLPVGRGVWISLYEKENTDPVTLVGAGAGRDHAPIAKVAISEDKVTTLEAADDEPQDIDREEAPLSIPEAKRRLAISLGVSEADIKITING